MSRRRPFPAQGRLAPRLGWLAVAACCCLCCLAPRDSIEEISRSPISMMPAGLVDSLADERDFLDLVRSVAEIAHGGKERERALAPAPESLVVADDTAGLDHAGILRDLSETHHQKQRGERMPQIDGAELPGLAAWQWAFAGSFDAVEANKPPRGPLRDDSLTYHGHYLHGDSLPTAREAASASISSFLALAARR